MPEHRIVITGAGVASAIGLGHEDFFNALLRGDSGVRSLAERDDDGRAGFAVVFDGVCLNK